MTSSSSPSSSWQHVRQFAHTFAARVTSSAARDACVSAALLWCSAQRCVGTTSTAAAAVTRARGDVWQCAPLCAHARDKCNNSSSSNDDADNNNSASGDDVGGNARASPQRAALLSPCDTLCVQQLTAPQQRWRSWLSASLTRSTTLQEQTTTATTATAAAAAEHTTRVVCTDDTLAADKTCSCSSSTTTQVTSHDDNSNSNTNNDDDDDDDTLVELAMPLHADAVRALLQRARSDGDGGDDDDDDASAAAAAATTMTTRADADDDGVCKRRGRRVRVHAADAAALSMLFPAVHHGVVYTTATAFVQHCAVSDEHLFVCAALPLLPLQPVLRKAATTTTAATRRTSAAAECELLCNNDKATVPSPPSCSTPMLTTTTTMTTTTTRMMTAATLHYFCIVYTALADTSRLCNTSASTRWVAYAVAARLAPQLARASAPLSLSSTALQDTSHMDSDAAAHAAAAPAATSCAAVSLTSLLDTAAFVYDELCRWALPNAAAHAASAATRADGGECVGEADTLRHVARAHAVAEGTSSTRGGDDACSDADAVAHLCSELAVCVAEAVVCAERRREYAAAAAATDAADVSDDDDTGDTACCTSDASVVTCATRRKRRKREDDDNDDNEDDDDDDADMCAASRTRTSDAHTCAYCHCMRLLLLLLLTDATRATKATATHELTLDAT